MKNLLSICDMPSDQLQSFFKLVDNFNNYLNILKNPNFKHGSFNPLKKIIGTLFLEPSTRTRISFEVAVKRMKGDVVTISDAKESSCSKGESISDTIRTMSQYVDLLIIRASEHCIHWGNNFDCPIINAGDGDNEHPTQSLIDTYTIQKNFGSLCGLKIAIIGDVAHGRTIHSLLKLLLRENQFAYDSNSLYICAPPFSAIEYEKTSGISLITTEQLLDILPQIDVLYMTRMQEERGTIQKPPFCLTNDIINRMHSNSIIMHPMPRKEELPANLDDNKRSVYFEQSKNGIPVRMALIKWIFENQ